MTHYPKTVLAAFVLLTLTGLYFLEGFPYNANLIDLQAHGLESVRYEKLLIEESDFSTWYCALMAESEDDVPEDADESAGAGEGAVSSEPAAADTDAAAVPADAETKAPDPSSAPGAPAEEKPVGTS